MNTRQRMRSGTRLGPYQITSSIGAGGMGEVFSARDTRLNRDVAIKVLPKELVADAERRRRFEQETKTLAVLNHPNVLIIHDAGVHEGAPYLVSELLEGKTLREEMNGAALPVRKATEYALQIAHGLAAAHGKGVVHRDLKPENIFVTKDGRVKILDFGLAKLRAIERGNKFEVERGPALSETASSQLSTEINITEPGVVLGTPAYMSPEQVCGEPADERADIFAFGSVLYEMLSGRRAFRRNTAVESMNAVLNDTPPELSTTNPNVPPALGRIVERCLAKQLANRFQSAQDLAFAIEAARDKGHPAPPGKQDDTNRFSRRRVVFGLAVLVLLTVGVRWWFVHQAGPIQKSVTNSSTAPSATSATDEKSIAVLPFVNMSPDKADEYLSDGMTEELLNVLAKVPGLRVPGRSSSFAFKGKTEDGIFRRVGEQLHVATVLEGSVRKAGEKLRITAKIINVKDGFQLWSETYDRDMTNIFAIQSDVAQCVAAALKIRLGAEETYNLVKRPTESLAAYQHYLQALNEWNKFTKEGFENCILQANAALQLDGRFALAWEVIGRAHTAAGSIGYVHPKTALAPAEAALDKARALGGELEEAHATRGAVALFLRRDWETARRELEKAIQLKPSNADGYELYSFYLIAMGRLPEALVSVTRDQELDPLRANASAHLGNCHIYLRRYERAIEEGKKGLQHSPHFPNLRSMLAVAYIAQGNAAEAIATMKQMNGIETSPFALSYLGYAYGAAGQKAEAAGVLDSLGRLEKAGHYVAPTYWARVYLGLGQTDRAFEWLERIPDEGDGFVPFMKVQPPFDRLLSEPRYVALLAKLGLKK